MSRSRERGFDVIVRGDRNRLWASYPTHEQAAEVVVKLRRQGFDAWLVTVTDQVPPRPHVPVQLELQFG